MKTSGEDINNVALMHYNVLMPIIASTALKNKASLSVPLLLWLLCETGSVSF